MNMKVLTCIDETNFLYSYDLHRQAIGNITFHKAGNVNSMSYNFINYP